MSSMRGENRLHGMSKVKNISRFTAKILCTVVLVWFILLGFGITGKADEKKNPDEVEIYCVTEEAAEVLGEVPAEKPQSFQISTEGLEGTPSYRIVSGSSVTVSATGLVEPRKTVWYWKGGFGSTAPIDGYDRIETQYYPGAALVRVTCGDYTQDIPVTVIELGNQYVNNRIQTIFEECTAGKTDDLEKFRAFTKWVGDNTVYNYRYQSWQDMLLFEGGDCWASTNLIVELSKMAGIDARINIDYQNQSSGSGHRDAIAKIGDTYYIGEAGYGYTTKPRGSSVYELPGGWYVSNIDEETTGVWQYCGFDEELIVPETVRGKTLTKFGAGNYLMFYNDWITSVRLPETVTSVTKRAFYGSDNLTTVYIPTSVTEFAEETWFGGNITDIYYAGSRGMWNRISNVGTLDLSGAVTIHYNSPHPTYAGYLPFTDLPRYKNNGDEYWQYEPIRFAYETGIISGDEDKDGDGLTTVRPNATINRGEFVTILYRMAGSPDVTGTAPFTDVNLKGDGTKPYYYDPVVWAYQQNLARGYADGTFGRKKELTRAEAVTILMRFAEMKGWDVSQQGDLSGFADYSSLKEGKAKPHWSLPYMKWAVGAGIISGIEEKDGSGNTVYRLGMNGKATRAQISKMLMSFLEMYQ